MRDYERKRLETIAQNRQMLESLGLLDGKGLLTGRPSGMSRPREKRQRVWEKREMPQRESRTARSRFMQ